MSAKQLQAAIAAFVAAPSDATSAAAKEEWLAARDDYLPTEVYRFYDGPIDHPKTGLEGQINAWPLDEAYIDGVTDDPESGIINDTSTYPEITEDVLVEANEKGGETNISTGWHAIEFLLWGQDSTTGQPGARPVTDYTTAANAARRAGYLTVANRPPRLRPRDGARGVGPRHEVPQAVGQERCEVGHQHSARHRRVERRRARRRAHGGRVRDQGPGRRALLLQRQHQRRHHGRPGRHPTRLPR